jgi:hypothetical protein
MKKIIKKNPIAQKAITKKPLAKKQSPVKSVTTPQKKGSWIKALAVGNIIAFIIVLIVNYLAVSIPLGGMTT